MLSLKLSYTRLCDRVLASSILLALFLSLSANAQTHVGGAITEDTEWLLSGSPYILDGWIHIQSGATLTIDSGVTVEMCSHYRIYIEDGRLWCSGVTFNGCGYENLIHFYGTGAGGTINNCILDTVYIEIYNSSPTITNNTISGNIFPIRLQDGGYPTISGNDLSGNTHVGIGVRVVDLYGDWVLPNYSVPYFPYSGGISLSTGYTLTISSGVTVEMYYSDDVYITNGTLYCNGVTFKGDSRIYFNETDSVGTITNCTLDGVNIDVFNSSPIITNNTITGIDDDAGIYIFDGGSPNPTIQFNDIFGNAAGLWNDEPSVIITAESNWWGDPSGPYHPTLNPGGLGNLVSDNVDFDPWSTSPNQSGIVRDETGCREKPSAFSLYQNCPNPFNPTTNIEFDLPRSGPVRIEIFNILGQKIRTLVNEHMKAGHWLVDWDGKDDNGNDVSSGIYFYRLQAGEFTQTKKMILLR
jgi:parallel beta-helix repeat protein